MIIIWFILIIPIRCVILMILLKVIDYQNCLIYIVGYLGILKPRVNASFHLIYILPIYTAKVSIFFNLLNIRPFSRILINHLHNQIITDRRYLLLLDIGFKYIRSNLFFRFCHERMDTSNQFIKYNAK